ncbi:hypothetical protein [Piscinibacter sp.]|uniref:hypothetical protein n=1 Tax=Piscinibacter sp. TaxID=1903157 RepID=UPI002C21C050|nr:hypothetical protein [Albitalea sp.]HUG21052.1 hypothetical protein [Albitalea sp.]
MLDIQCLGCHSRYRLEQPRRVARVDRKARKLSHTLAEAGAPKGLLQAKTMRQRVIDLGGSVVLDPEGTRLHARMIGRGRRLSVRWRTYAALAKTGTNRQAELVRLALSSAAAHLLASVPDLHA